MACASSELLRACYPAFNRTQFTAYLVYQNKTMQQQANLVLLLFLLFCLPSKSIAGSPTTRSPFDSKSKWVGETDYKSPATGLVVVGGESAELWTPDTLVVVTSDDSKNLKNGSQHSGKQFTLDSCNLPPPPSPMYGHTLDLVNNTVILVHGDSSYQLNSHGWTRGPNTTYNRCICQRNNSTHM